jgi:hypothetical protein
VILPRREEPFYYNHGLTVVSDTVATGNGFSPPQQTLFAPVVAFAPPGPDRPARAIAAIDRAIPFFRRLLFHPEFDPALDQLVAQLPPRESTLVRAAVLYADSSIPWNREANATHAIIVNGRTQGKAFVFTLAPAYQEPVAPFNFVGMFALSPSASRVPLSGYSTPLTLIGRLAGDTTIQGFGAAAIVDAWAIGLREIYGDLEAPWDTRPGQFNRHDRAILNRLKANAPTFSARLAHYLMVENVLDEFSTAAGVLVLVNVDARVRCEALRAYPALYRFYMRFATRIRIHSTIVDRHGNRWLEAGFDRGRIRLQFAVRAGLLAPLKAQLASTGRPIALDQIMQGQWRSITTMTLDKFGTTFGLGNVAFTTNFQRAGDRFELNSRMDTVPQLIAPPVVDSLLSLLAGNFLQGLARGHGGMMVSLQSEHAAQGLFHIRGALCGELRYSPMLEMLAEIGDAVADAHDIKVRDDERRLGEELFNALLADYNKARERIINLQTPAEIDSDP